MRAYHSSSDTDRLWGDLAVYPVFWKYISPFVSVYRHQLNCWSALIACFPIRLTSNWAARRRGKANNIIPDVKDEKDSSLFWHKLWVENGCPRNGIIASRRRGTRVIYWVLVECSYTPYIILYMYYSVIIVYHSTWYYVIIYVLINYP